MIPCFTHFRSSGRPKQFQVQELRERVQVWALNSPTTGEFGRWRMKNQAHFNMPKVSPPPPQGELAQGNWDEKASLADGQTTESRLCIAQVNMEPLESTFFCFFLFFFPGGKLVCWLHLGLRSRISHTHGGIVKALRVRHCHTFLRGM